MLKLRVATSERDSGDGGMPEFMVLFHVVFVLVLFGLTMLYSTSTGIGKGDVYFIKQSIWVCLGVSAGWFIYWLGYERLCEWAFPLLVVSAIALVTALFFPKVNGARRWIRFHGLSVQPSEFAKLCLVLYLGVLLSREQRFIHSFVGIWPASAWTIMVLVLILVGDDLGTTVLLASVAALMFFIAGALLRWLFLPMLLLLPLLLLYIGKYDQERLSRMTSFLHPEKVSGTAGYQLWNSLLALGSGGWFGLGFARSRMKEMYLPEAHTDFILSIVGEELGFVGIACVIAGYVAFTITGMWIAFKAPDKKGTLIAFGATALISLQAVINLGVVSGALPTKGMPAPFISYGGSNMLMALCCVGLLLSVDKARRNALAKVA